MGPGPFHKFFNLFNRLQDPHFTKPLYWLEFQVRKVIKYGKRRKPMIHKAFWAFLAY